MSDSAGSPEDVNHMSLVGNISVSIRFRSLNDRERENGNQIGWRIDPSENSVRCISELSRGSANAFIFDKIFPPECVDNKEIYESTIRNLTRASIRGVNSTVFAYGQTSAGKTFTMLGNQNNPGIIRCSLQHIFDHCQQDHSREYSFRISMLEIYNEAITDLLYPENGNLKIHESISVLLGNLAEEPVGSLEEAMALLRKGDQTRHVGETNMNEKSSRSHSIFRIIIESRSAQINESDRASSVGPVLEAALTFVDLAGSEKARLTGAEGLRLKEGGHINKSLLALTSVVSKLAEGSDRTHIPYRDSKLTRILQGSLGGNANTSIICVATPASDFIEETLSTLKFASRAKAVKTKPRINEIISAQDLLMKLREENERLKTELIEARDLASAHQWTPKRIKYIPDAVASPATLSSFSQELQEARECIASLNRRIELSNEDSLFMIRKSRLQVTGKLESMFDVYAYSMSKYVSVTEERISDLEATNSLLSQKLEAGHSVANDLEQFVKEAQIEIQKHTEDNEDKQKVIEQLEIDNEKLRSRLDTASQVAQTCHQCSQVDQSLELIYVTATELAKSLPTISDFLEYMQNTDKRLQASSQLAEELRSRELEGAMLLGKLSTLQNDLLLKQAEYNESLKLLHERLNSSEESSKVLKDRCEKLEDDLEASKEAEASIGREKSELFHSLESIRADHLCMLREKENVLLQLQEAKGLQERLQEECSHAQEQLSWKARELQALTDQLTALRGELLEARTANLALNSSLQTSGEEFREARGEIERLQLEKNSLRQELLDVQRTYATREEKLWSAWAEHKDIKSQLGRFEVENFALSQELAEREQILDTLEAKKAEDKPAVILRIELEKLREQSSKEIRLLRLKVADLEEELSLKK